MVLNLTDNWHLYPPPPIQTLLAATKVKMSGSNKIKTTGMLSNVVHRRVQKANRNI